MFEKEKNNIEKFMSMVDIVQAKLMFAENDYKQGRTIEAYLHLLMARLSFSQLIAQLTQPIIDEVIRRTGSGPESVFKEITDMENKIKLRIGYCQKCDSVRMYPFCKCGDK